MPDSIEAVRADQAALLEIGRGLPLDRTVPIQKSSTARPGSRFSVPRGLIAGTLAAAALVWGQYAVIPGASLLSAQVQTGIYLCLLLRTAAAPATRPGSLPPRYVTCSPGARSR